MAKLLPLKNNFEKGEIRQTNLNKTRQITFTKDGKVSGTK